MVSLGVYYDYSLINPYKEIRPIGLALVKKGKRVAAANRVSRPNPLRSIKSARELCFKRVQARILSVE